MRVVLLAAMVPLELRSEVDSVCAHGGRAAFERVAGRGKRWFRKPGGEREQAKPDYRRQGPYAP
jgi:hypothetical protein